MTVTQEGVFRHGTFGLPVDITLSATPIDLAGATAISIAVKRPDETDYDITADLTLPDAIIDEDGGEIEWLPAEGDLTVKGTYHLVLTILFGPTMTLTVEGTMRVS
jgi:hypothetical protein